MYFSVESFPEYGRLSRQKPDQVEQGEEPTSLKRDPRDFALWKANKPATEDTWWDSPWGRGRPGWHIECSVMAEEIYGPAFEIHGGGLDLVFPHHENEVAQSRALGHPFASIWTHNGMLRFTGEKMSKSTGNVATIREALDQWGREAILVFYLTASWRKPIDYSDETMQQAAARRDTLRNAFTLEPAPVEEERWEAFAAALEDDFDTPAALAVLHEWAAAGSSTCSSAASRCSGLARLQRGRRRHRRWSRLPSAVPRRGPTATSRPRTGCVTSSPGSAGRCVTGLTAAIPSFVTPDLVYGRRSVREALRGRREVLEVWATERAVKAEPWLAEAQPRLKLDRELSERADTRDHQGVLAIVEPYPYADAYELAAGERPLLAVLDRVTDPRNLGAVCRSAEGAGRPASSFRRTARLS